MDSDYFSYNKDTTAMEDKDPLWLMNQVEVKEEGNHVYRENKQTMVQWDILEQNTKPSLYTKVPNTEPLLIPNNGARDTHKPKRNNGSKRLAHTFPNTINNESTFGGVDWSKQEKRKSQPTFFFTVGSLQKEEGPVPWPANLVTKSHEKQRRRPHHSNGYNKSAYDEEDLIFSMDDT